MACSSTAESDEKAQSAAIPTAAVSSSCPTISDTAPPMLAPITPIRVSSGLSCLAVAMAARASRCSRKPMDCSVRMCANERKSKRKSEYR